MDIVVFTQQSSQVQHSQIDIKTLESLLHNNPAQLIDILSFNSVPQETLYTLLAMACEERRDSIVNSMLTTDSYTKSVLANILVDAIANSDSDFVSYLHQIGSFKERVLNTALHAAVGRGSTFIQGHTVVQELVTQGADPLSKDEQDRTVLTIANECIQPDNLVIDFLNEKIAKQIAPITVMDLSQQAQRSKAFQDLAGKESVMPHMKIANAKDQIAAMKPVTKNSDKLNVNVVDIGGGDGLTAPVLGALKAKKDRVNVLNVEPEVKYEQQYRSAHQSVGVNVSGVLAKNAQDLTVDDVFKAFPNGADVVFASHSMYFELGDIYNCSQGISRAYDSGWQRAWVKTHPLTKYLDVLAQDGVFVVTLGSAQELGATRTMVLGNHNLDLKGDPLAPKDSSKFLGPFKNMQLFAKGLECFIPFYEAHRNCTIEYESCSSKVTRVPLNQYEVVLNEEFDVYEVLNPTDQAPELFQAPDVFRFYANWPTLEEVRGMNETERVATKERQSLFLHLLPLFKSGDDLMLRDETFSIRKTSNNK